MFVFFDGKIRGRGNSTWALNKKTYRIKLNEKISLLGEPKDKHWCLLANHFDKTLLRNALAFYVGSMSKLEWTPKSHFVEVMLNGRYNGTYQLTEAIKVNEHRVNIDEDGFLLEIDNHLRDDEIGFTTTRLRFPVRIHEPDVAVGDENYMFISNFVQRAEDVLYSTAFLDSNNGYASYIDKESFAEWYVISELLDNAEAAGTSYMTLAKGGKLKAGPLWDFDLSLACNPYANEDEEQSLAFDPEVFFVRPAMWYPRLFEDPVFVNLVKERLSIFIQRRKIYLIILTQQ